MIEIFRGKNKQWYFRVKAKNNKIIAQSEGYKNKRNAYNGITSLTMSVEGSEIKEV